MDVRVLIEETNKHEFEGDFQLVEFLQNQFRTDKNQKYTNKNTEYCVVSFYLDEKLTSIPFGDINRRIDLKDVSLELIEAYGIDAGDVESNIISLSFVDENNRDIKSKLDYEDVIDIINRVITQRKDFNRHLFHIVHLDQCQYHIHSLIVK